MTEAQIAAILSRLDTIDKRLRRLESGAVTWKTLMLVVGTMAAAITSIVTVGNQLWGG